MDAETETAMTQSHLPVSLTRDSQRERATQLYAAVLFKLLTMDEPSPRSASASSITVASTLVRPIVYAEVWSDGSKQQVALQLPSRGDHRYSAEQWARAGQECGGSGLQWVEQHVRQARDLSAVQRRVVYAQFVARSQRLWRVRTVLVR